MDLQSDDMQGANIQADMERFMFFEHARQTAEDTYVKNPLDADNLTRWGGALLEISQFQTISESKRILQEAISKLGEALLIEPSKHDALWCIGNAHTSYGFLISNHTEAKGNFEKASYFFQLALDEQPENVTYRRSLELTLKAPELHKEVHKHGDGPQPLGGAAGPSSTSAKTMKQKKNSDFKYDVLGWVILAGCIVTWIGFAKSHMPVSKQ